MENRNGLVIDAHLRQPMDARGGVAGALRDHSGSNGALRHAAPFLNEPRNQNDVPSEKNQAAFVRQLTAGGYAASQRLRKRIEEAFAWIQATAGQKRTKFQDRQRARAFPFAAPAYSRARLLKRCDQEDVLRATRATSLKTLDCQAIRRLFNSGSAEPN
jgi:hypothetical protein